MFGRLTSTVSELLGGGEDEVPTPIEAEDPWRDLETEETDGGQRFAGTVVLPAGTFASRKLDQDGDVQFAAQFDADRAFDLYLVPDYFVDGYRTGGTFASDGDASVEGRSEADYEVELTESQNGPHHVVFDNSGRGATEPDGEVRVEFEIAVSE